MTATMEFLDNAVVLRPTFTEKHTSIVSKRKNERRFVPSALVPHTVEIAVQSEGCTIVFEYTIDELKDRTITSCPDVSVTLGRYTKKVLLITLSYANIAELPRLLLEAEEVIVRLQRDDNRESLNRNYSLISELLRDVAQKYQTDAQFREFLKE